MESEYKEKGNHPLHGELLFCPRKHQDPTLPGELGMRRNIIRAIVRILEEKYLKEVSLSFLQAWKTAPVEFLFRQMLQFF